MSDELRKVPVVFLGGNVGVSKSEKNRGKKFISFNVTELTMTQDGVPYLLGYGADKQRTIFKSYFKWFEEWTGTPNFDGIKPFDILYLCFANAGLSGGKLVDFELAKSTTLVDDYFGI